ncbi:MAG TPA: hypothetical protein VM115_00320 [Vicinamibacterales bacterium]|nr:hypothetical protein [Vicinamibacterales bacterium]
MVADDDWRLTGQEAYLTGVTLSRQRWQQPRADWDHDHCEFCWAKFMLGSNPEEEYLHEGWTTEDRYRWICDDCFRDFRQRFGWQVLEK